MLLTWTEFWAFVNTTLQEFVQTEYAQVRYGDIAMAFVLAGVVGGAIALTLARLVLRRRRHSRHHSGHEIDLVHQKRLWVTTSDRPSDVKAKP